MPVQPTKCTRKLTTSPLPTKRLRRAAGPRPKQQQRRPDPPGPETSFADAREMLAGEANRDSAIEGRKHWLETHARAAGGPT
jgi:hypothetical protein